MLTKIRDWKLLSFGPLLIAGVLTLPACDDNNVGDDLGDAVEESVDGASETVEEATEDLDDE